LSKLGARLYAVCIYRPAPKKGAEKIVEEFLTNFTICMRNVKTFSLLALVKGGAAGGGAGGGSTGGGAGAVPKV